MATHIQWVDATHAVVDLVPPGEDWAGADQQTDHVMTVQASDGSVVAIEGDPQALRRFVQKVVAIGEEQGWI